MLLRKRPLIIAAVFAVFGIIVGLVMSSNFGFHVKGYTDDSKITEKSVQLLSRTNQAMAELVAVVKPSVVNIASVRKVKSGGVPSPFTNDPFFRRFFGDNFGPPEKQKEFKKSGQGSGVIVDKEGYILTNNHVVRGADEIKVTLSDQREFRGKVIGADPKTDLAVIKIDSDNLPVIAMGDSDRLKVGETVLAVGNPYGLSHTVTSGIVSATGRANVGIADYEDFIQTDAPINPGNSGGALVNIKGELIGINTAIFSTTGGYQGIGFSIPSNMAKNVMESLIAHGKVVRGWLGVTIQPLTQELVRQFHLKDDKGVLVGDVNEESPAQKAGILRGDVIIEYDGRKVDGVVGLRNMVAGTVPEREVRIQLLRDGKPQAVEVRITEMSAEPQKLAGTFENQLKGVVVRDLTPSMKKTLDIPNRINGVLIADIADESPADDMLRKNDVIMEINRTGIADTREYERALSKIRSDENILLLVFRQNSTFYVTLSSQ
ncbi:MAG: Do family serine endopeptidase [Nitrospirota bacterium]